MPKDPKDETSKMAAKLGRLGGKKRQSEMTREQRSELGKLAAAKRWNKPKDQQPKAE